MGQPPPPPALVEAYNLIKAGQKQDAGRILKTYLAQHKDDSQGWWLMSHAASQPETIRRCLETVLKLDPGNTKARAMLDRMLDESDSASPPESEPQAAPRTASKPAAPPQAAPRTASKPADPQSAPRAQSKPAAPQSVPRTASKPADPQSAPRTASKPAPGVPRTASQPARALPGARPPAGPGIVPVPTASVADDDFPPDELVLAAGIVVGAAAAAPPALQPTPRTPSKPAASSFEDYLTATPSRDPFAGPPVDDPFAPVTGQPPAASSEDLFAPTRPGSYNPFDTANTFNPAAHAKLSSDGASTIQAPGTGNQPEWGPGLAFVPDANEPVSLDDDDDYDYAEAKSRVERMIKIAAAIFAVFIVVALILWYLDSAGWLTLRGDSVPDLTRMDAGSFTIEYPKGWDQRCEADVSGYPVCGIANHSFYNEVDFFASTDIDLGAMMANSIGMMFGGESPPENQVSIIVMDVPRSSPSYDNGSWAKTNYEWSQSSWAWNPGAKVKYDRKDITVDGYPGYYYEYTSDGGYREAAWDVYVEHDGVILWFRVDYYGPRSKKVPHNTVEAMIESIDIKPIEEWSN